MNYNAKNYTEQGGDKTVIGGTLEIKEGATVIGLGDSVMIHFEYNEETEKWEADVTVDEAVEKFLNLVPVYAAVKNGVDEGYNLTILHLETVNIKNGTLEGLRFSTGTNWNYSITVENGEWSVNLPE